jgi:hypothetical protein
MDHKKVQKSKVADYLDSKGIDLENNRFLILQGEVEMISMMPPKGKEGADDGLLEYLEDIIGSNKYVEDADKAMKEVEALTEQRQEKLNRVKAVEKEKETLEGGKLEAEQFMAKEREIRKKQNVLYQMNMLEVATEKSETKERYDSYVSRLEDQKTELEESEARLAEIEQGHSAQMNEFDGLANDLKAAKEVSAFERKRAHGRSERKTELERPNDRRQQRGAGGRSGRARDQPPSPALASLARRASSLLLLRACFARAARQQPPSPALASLARRRLLHSRGGARPARAARQQPPSPALARARFARSRRAPQLSPLLTLCYLHRSSPATSAATSSCARTSST